MTNRTTPQRTGSRSAPISVPSPVADRLGSLRDSAVLRPAEAQNALWDWIGELGAARDARTLEALFELGSPPQVLDGVTDGILVTTLINPLIDLPVRLLTRLWMPWRGKVFDAGSQTGINRMSASATFPARLLWPLYGMRSTRDGLAAFEFVFGREPGRVAPRVPVMKIDYEPVRDNPCLIIRQIRDELVELTPGTFLGRVLFRVPTPAGVRFTNIGYFALRQPTGA